MLRKCTIDGQKYPIDQADVLGSGGEAVVVKVKLGRANAAVKIYHKIDAARIQKLKDFIALPPFPKNVYAPLKLVYDAAGRKVVGFVMNLAPRGNEVVQRLASKSFRKANPACNSRFVTDLFINGHSTVEEMHSRGVIIGDFNDLNMMFRSTDFLFIDVDSFQFGNHPCMVATENFLAPELFNMNLSTGLHFKPEHDWYAFLAMYIRSLLLVHPYGGTHKDYRTIPQRALARVIAFDDGVKYPKPAFSPDLLNDDLFGLIDRMFKKGERFPVPVETLREYRNSLVQCNSCSAMHPAERSSCPQCATINMQQVQRRVKVVGSPGKMTVHSEILLETPGNFIWHRVSGKTVLAIAHEGSMYALYRKELGGSEIRQELFVPKRARVKFDMFGGRYLVVSQDSSDEETLILDVSGSIPQGVHKTLVAGYEGDRVFACSRNHMLRAFGGTLFRGDIHPMNRTFSEVGLGGVMKNQTWITASPMNDLVFGFQRFFGEMNYFLYRFDRRDTGERYDVQLPRLDDHESIIDASVQFAATSILFMMKTEISGRTYTRVFVIHRDNGDVLVNYRVEALSSDTHRNIHGKAFAKPSGSHGVILHPTDDGVVQEVLGATGVGKQTLLTETEQFVAETDKLDQFGDGILVVGDHLVSKLTMT